MTDIADVRVGEPTPSAGINASWLGMIDYPAAWSWQRELFLARLEGDIDDTLMLLEHPHTYTLGRRAIEDDLVYDSAQRAARGISLFNVDRGGRATYHGPGQLVGYPIIDLGPRADLAGYVRKLESVMTGALKRFGIDAVGDPDNTGAWVGSNKIGAIGVRVARNVTKHGFALNVAPDLSYFAGIVPCGITDKGVTSMAVEIDRVIPTSEVAVIVAHEFARVFGYEA